MSRIKFKRTLWGITCYARHSADISPDINPFKTAVNYCIAVNTKYRIFNGIFTPRTVEKF